MGLGFKLSKNRSLTIQRSKIIDNYPTEELLTSDKSARMEVVVFMMY